MTINNFHYPVLQKCQPSAVKVLKPALHRKGVIGKKITCVSISSDINFFWSSNNFSSNESCNFLRSSTVNVAVSNDFTFSTSFCSFDKNAM